MGQIRRPDARRCAPSIKRTTSDFVLVAVLVGKRQDLNSTHLPCMPGSRRPSPRRLRPPNLRLHLAKKCADDLVALEPSIPDFSNTSLSRIASRSAPSPHPETDHPTHSFRRPRFLVPGIEPSCLDAAAHTAS